MLEVESTSEFILKLGLMILVAAVVCFIVIMIAMTARNNTMQNRNTAQQCIANGGAWVDNSCVFSRGGVG